MITCAENAKRMREGDPRTMPKERLKEVLDHLAACPPCLAWANAVVEKPETEEDEAAAQAGLAKAREIWAEQTEAN